MCATKTNAAQGRLTDAHGTTTKAEFGSLKFDWLDQVNADPELRDGDLKTALAMAKRINKDTRVGFGGVRDIQMLTGMSLGFIVASIARLETRGHIAFTERGRQGRGHSHHYRLVLKVHADEQLEAPANVHSDANDAVNVHDEALNVHACEQNTFNNTFKIDSDSYESESIATAPDESNTDLFDGCRNESPEGKPRPARKAGRDARAKIFANASPPDSRGSRIAEDWKPSPSDLDFARQKGLSPPEIQDEAERFVDHWRAESRASAVKRDWRAAWRNWVRNALKFKQRDAAREQARNGYRRRTAQDLAAEIELGGALFDADQMRRQAWGTH